MLDNKQNIKIMHGSEKNFGLTFSIVFLLLALYPLLHGGVLQLWAIGFSIMFIIIAYLAPRLLILPNKMWGKLGIALGSIIAPMVMALVFFATVVPIGLIMKLLGKDMLRQKLDDDAITYWITRNHPIGSMKDQF